MDFSLTDEQRLLVETTARLMARHAPPDVIRRHDAERRYPYAVYRAWVEAGLLAIPFPEAYGGVGGSAVDLALAVEEISRSSTDFCMMFAGTVFSALNILRKGSEAQKRYWLPRVIGQGTRLAIGISEPEAGSDVGAIRTRARRSGDRFIVNGQKLWTSGAGLDDTVLCTYVRTNPDGHYRDGLSLLLIDNDMPGVECRKLDMLGRRCTGTYEVFFRDVEVPEDRLIGAENGGWDCLMSGLQIERAVSACGNTGGAQGVVDLAAAYAREREQFGRPIGSFQAIGHMLADMQTEVDASRLLSWRAAWMAATGQEALREITIAKLHSSETYVKVVGQGVQIMGAYGLNAEYDMQRHFRDARSVTIAAGTSQTQRNLIAGLMGLKTR